MLKPLKPKESSKSLVKPSKNPTEIVVSIINGKKVYSNADTGEIINMDQTRYTPSYEVFNNQKASIIVSSIAQGMSLISALENASTTKASFSTWLMANQEFADAIDKARATRAQFTHEEFYQLSSRELMSELPDDEEDMKLHSKKLSIIERRQRILKEQKKEDNPTRFGSREAISPQMTASVAISIDPDIVSKMQSKFSSSLDSEGHLDVDREHRVLESILDAEYKEVESE